MAERERPRDGDHQNDPAARAAFRPPERYQIAPPAPVHRRSLFDRCFRDRRTGRIVIVQFPNIPLWIYLATVVLGRLMPKDVPFLEPVRWAGAAALAWWGLDELLRGVNPLRRALGLGGLGAAAWTASTLLA